MQNQTPMGENPQQNVSQPAQPTPSQGENVTPTSNIPEQKEKKKKLSLPLILLLIMIILSLIAIIALLIIKGRRETEVEKNVTDTPTDEEDEGGTEEDEVDEDTSDTSPRDQDRIVYIKNNNVWVMNNDGTGKVQLTTDGSDTVRYMAVDWKSPGVVSYAKCDEVCTILIKDIESEVEELIYTGIPLIYGFGAVEWSYDGATLAFLSSQEESLRKVALWNGSREITLHTYRETLGRGVGFSDGQYIQWCPDNSKLILFNTFIDGAFDKSIMVFDVNGTKLVEISDAVFPVFDGNDAFYYLDTEGLKRWNLSTSSSTTVTATVSGYDIKLSADRNFIAFWDENESTARLNYYDTGGSSGVIANNLARAEWLDDASQYLVAIISSGQDISGDLNYEGLVKVKRIDGTTSVLETTVVLIFEVE